MKLYHYSQTKYSSFPIKWCYFGYDCQNVDVLLPELVKIEAVQLQKKKYYWFKSSIKYWEKNKKFFEYSCGFSN